MAIYHFSSKVFSRSKGHSAIAASAYRSGQNLVDVSTGEKHDYTKKSEVDYRKIFAPCDVPNEFNDRSHLWNLVEKTEKRRDAQLCREFEMSLPVEVGHDWKKIMVESFAKSLAEKGMFVDAAIHKINSENPHVHMLCTMRHFDPISLKFGKKNRNWNSRDLLEELRSQWSVTVNNVLKINNIEQRVDHRSFERQRFDTTPQNGETEQLFERRMMDVQKIPTIHRGKFIEHSKGAVNDLDRYQRMQAINSMNAEITCSQIALRDVSEAIQQEQSYPSWLFKGVEKKNIQPRRDLSYWLKEKRSEQESNKPKPTPRPHNDDFSPGR